MIKEIKYGGFTASPSDYESPDGELAALIGLVPDEGNLKPIMPPNELFKLEGGKVIRFVHETSAFRHYIILDPATNIVSWTDDGTASTQLYNFTKSRTIHNINAIGNTIVILADNGMHYFLWKSVSEGYLYLGTHMPECPISFGLQGSVEKTDKFSVSVSVPQSQEELTEEQQDVVTNPILAKVNKFIAEKSVNAGRFMYPFFVRYAYRLYDGSLTMHSSPILMPCCTSGCPLAPFKTLTVNNGTIKSINDIVIIAAFHELDYAVKNSSKLDELKKWKDIVQSIDIFISKPIYTYDQNGKIKDLAAHGVGSSTICKHVNQHHSIDKNRYPAKYAVRDMVGMFYNTYPDEDRTLYLGLGLPYKSDEQIEADLRSTSQFYYLQSIKLEDLKTERTKVPIETDYLQSLVAREVMTDDYDSHDRLAPTYSFGYNAKLNITGIRKKLYSNYETGDMVCYSDAQIEAELFNESAYLKPNHNYMLYFFIKQEGKEIVVEGNSSALAIDHEFFYLYYPNTNAYKVVINDVTANTYKEYILERHGFLNGAYYFGGFRFFAKKGKEVSSVVATSNNEIYLPNKIYTSEVNNPFYFPVLGINTVGTGTILGISTAAKALSQGQFGQFPLYAFTTEGVWALEVSSTGGYSAKQPITRDVCINADSITQLDSAVLFATDRGIMLISGSNSQCISDTLDYSQVFSIDSLPQADKLVTMAGFKAEDFAYVPFRDYLLGCRMIYAYTQQRVIVYNPAHSYAYVYSLKTKTWGMMQSYVADNVPSYPEALAMLKDGTLVDFCTDAAQQQDDDGHLQGIKGLLITRPLKLDAPDLLKTIDTAIQRGNFRKGSIKSALYGSRDLQNWSLIWTSQDHYLRGFRGTPYKYFRFALLCDMQPDESLFGATIQYTPRLLNQPR